MNTVGLLE